MLKVVSMDKSSIGSNGGGGRWAPLKNVHLCSRALDRAMNRSSNLPGLVVHYGPSGYGKSMAASYCANKHEAIYVVCRSYFTRKAFVEAVLAEMRIRAAKTIPHMMEQVAEQLHKSQRPLIIDEMDHLVDRNAIELVRDLHEMARGAILLIGEENFPHKLQRWERFFNRVLVWAPAQPADLDDVHKLAAYYCPERELADDLLEALLKAVRGVVRQVCVNLNEFDDFGQKHGLAKLDLKAWGKRGFITADAPPRRPL